MRGPRGPVSVWRWSGSVPGRSGRIGASPRLTREAGERSPGGRPAGRVLTSFALLALLPAAFSVVASAGPAAAADGGRGLLRQEAADTVPPRPGPADTVGGDTTRADTVEGPELYYPAASAVGDTGSSAVVWRCDRSCLLNHSAHNLLDLLEAEWPGSVPLRGGYFGGPHHLADGLVGPVLTEVRIEEMPLPSLAGGQVDLTRIPLAMLSEVAVVRRAGRLEVRLDPIRHRTPTAYSRVTAGTGEPNLSLVRGVFTNGLGDHLSVSTGIDLLDTGGPRAGGGRLDFWGLASWVPADGGGGAELLWRTQNVTRPTAPTGDGGETGPLEEFRRRDAYLRGRGILADGVRIHVSAGRSRWSETGDGDGGVGAGGEEPDGPPRVEAEGASLTVQAERPWGVASASFETWTGPARPSVEGRLFAGVRPAPGLRVDVSLRAGRWRGFTTRSYGGGVRWTPDLGADLSLHASGARGTAGVPRPWSGLADSVSFREYRGGLSAGLGPYRVTGLAALQDFGRQLPFSATFDRGVEPVVAPELLIGQGSVEGPLVPLGLVFGPTVNPMELDVTVRRSRVRSDARPLYVPRTLVEARMEFRDEFFQDDLGVTFGFGGRYRSGMATVDWASGEVTEVPSRTSVEWSLVLRIVDARIWYRSENVNRILAGNLAGQEYPPIRNSFGIKWEFRN